LGGPSTVPTNKSNKPLINCNHLINMLMGVTTDSTAPLYGYP
jgi:hypothetical protein